jgi:hypothetical protein
MASRFIHILPQDLTVEIDSETRLVFEAAIHLYKDNISTTNSVLAQIKKDYKTLRWSNNPLIRLIAK